jgi:hypothetical protein
MATFYTVKQTAKILGFSTNSIYKFLDEGRLKGQRGNSASGRFKIPHSSLEKFIGSSIPETSIKQALQLLPELNIPPEKDFSSLPPTPIETPTAYNPGLSLKLTRTLIILSLLCLLLDLVLSQNFSLPEQILRLTIMGILIILTYQYGGLNSKSYGS